MLPQAPGYTPEDGPQRASVSPPYMLPDAPGYTPEDDPQRVKDKKQLYLKIDIRGDRILVILVPYFMATKGEIPLVGW